nr:superinducible protein 24, SIP24=cyclophilin homolog, peak D [mice, BALB/c 3T3, Peptide Partial, 7 aa] [Mus sp.]
TFVPSSR